MKAAFGQFSRVCVKAHTFVLVSVDFIHGNGYTVKREEIAE